MNIILIGMPGSGKTTVAREFALSGKTVVDTDEEIVKQYGVISDIFANHGEEYFRDIETATVKKLGGLNGAVIATGGGCVLRSENVQALKQNGKIVYLRTGLETLVKRVENNTGRPLLAGNPRLKLENLYNTRTPVYENAADIIIDTDNLLPKKIADLITEKLI